jgi:succinoglycan biosynthesis transport protein ExoP
MRRSLLRFLESSIDLNAFANTAYGRCDAMLQVNGKHSLTDRYVPASEFGSQAQLLESILGIVRRRLSLIIGAITLTTVLGVVYLLITPPSFTAKATMVIDARKVQLFQQPSLLGDIPVDAATVDSQVEILRSENVILPVIKQLHLTEDPEFIGPRGGLLGKLFQFVVTIFQTREPRSDFEIRQRALREFEDRLTVKRVRQTYVIEISFRSFSAERAAEIANAITDAYATDQLDAKIQATRRAGSWLQDRITELGTQSLSAERKVVGFKTQNDIVDTGGRLLTEQRLAELNSQLVLASAHRAETKARLDRIEEITRADVSDATVTDTLRNDVITKLRSQYLDLTNREAELSARYGSDHLAAAYLRNQKREIRRSIVDELRRIAETYKSDYEIATQREEAIKKGLHAVVSQSHITNEAQVTLRELESSAQTYRALYDTFLQRYTESVQQQSFPITDARVISRASRPLEKSHPKTALVLAISSLGGILLSFSLALLRDLSDRAVRTRDEVETMLQMDCIAVVPMAKDRPGIHSTSHNGSCGVPIASRTITRKGNIFWTVVDSPVSRFSESIRSIKVAVDVRSDNKVIGVTSSLPNEGKSTLAAALAQLIAQTGARTILVDGNLRDPSLSYALSPGAKLGVLDVVSATASLADAVWQEPCSGLTFLPTVITEPYLGSLSEILSSNAAKVLFDKLRESYDYIIVDVPPLEPIVDVRATAQLVDSYIFIVQWGYIKSDVVMRALKSAPSVHEKILGAVLNKTDMRALGRHEGHRSAAYHYNKH